MKLHTRKQLMTLPSGTIYSRVDPDSSTLMYGIFQKMCDPEDGLGDFFEQDLMCETGFPLAPGNPEGSDNHEYVLGLRDSFKTFRVDMNTYGRDGLFQEEDLFVVWDKTDIKKLVDVLNDAMGENDQSIKDTCLCPTSLVRPYMTTPEGRLCLRCDKLIWKKQ